LRSACDASEASGAIWLASDASLTASGSGWGRSSAGATARYSRLAISATSCAVGIRLADSSRRRWGLSQSYRAAAVIVSANSAHRDDTATSSSAAVGLVRLRCAVDAAKVEAAMRSASDLDGLRPGDHPAAHAADIPVTRPREFRRQWSDWRRYRQAAARKSHYARRIRDHEAPS
jgi:hypothetical protein